MSSDLYFVETSKVEISGRLFVKLSNDAVFYFGGDVEKSSSESYLRDIFFIRMGDKEKGVWRGLTVEKQGQSIFIVETLYSGEFNRSKPAIHYKYLLDDLVKHTQAWTKDDHSFWGEYNALANKHKVLPTFPGFAITCTPKR